MENPAKKARTLEVLWPAACVRSPALTSAPSAQGEAGSSSPDAESSTIPDAELNVEEADDLLTADMIKEEQRRAARCQHPPSRPPLPSGR